MKLGLGTVQFGIDYGVSNKAGRVSEHEVEKILRSAFRSGIRVIDTAIGYGISQQVLGNSKQDLWPLDAKIVSKIPALSDVPRSQKKTHIFQLFEKALTELRRSKIYGLMVHHAPDVLGPDADIVIDALSELKQRGKIEVFGASLYDPEQAEALLGRFDISLVQIPLNILDQRFVAQGALKKLKDKKVEIHSRSAFLQGLLLMDLARLPAHFAPLKARLQRLEAIAAEYGLNRAAICLAYAYSVVEVDCVLVGVCSEGELAKNLDDVAKIASVRIPWAEFSLNDPQMINPALWPPSTKA